MTIHIRGEAEAELGAAFDYYNERRLGLGDEFLQEFVRGTRKIAETPHRWARDRDVEGVHRYRLDRFPYAIVYNVSPNECMIFAVMNLYQRPGYWRSRLKP